jgi:uncharacterized repeat protein (TIGR03803 family)
MRPTRLKTYSIATCLLVLLCVATGSAHAQSFNMSVLHGFSGADGAQPKASLIMDGSGNLYGTTNFGGSSGDGTVFELVNSNSTYSEKVLYSFPGTYSGGTGGAYPLSNLILDGSGNLYGTTEYSAFPNPCGSSPSCGTVFELVNSSGSYSEEVLYNFLGGNDGAFPHAGLLMGPTGTLYGTAYDDGAEFIGTVFELSNSGGTYVENTLAEPVAYPNAGLIADASGNLYGTTVGVLNNGSCPNGCGAVFKLNYTAPNSYSLQVLYEFAGNAPTQDGANPFGGLVMDASGNLYGTTAYGGYNAVCTVGFNTQGCGTVFELVNSNGSYSEKVLYRFTGYGADGAFPSAGLVMDAAGNLYGTTPAGGAHGNGTVFELVNSSGTYTEQVLYGFCSQANCADGADPVAGLLIDASGNLYGTTTGGSYNNGTVFELARINTTSVAVASNANPASYGQSVTLTATISVGNPANMKRQTKLKTAEPQTITGTVSWSADTGCGTSAVTGNPATATCMTSSLPVGTSTITAAYSGDSNDTASTGTLSGGQVVNQASQTISCTGIPASAAYGSGFTASCSATSNLPVSYASFGGCSNSGASYSMTSGTTACSVVVTQAGNADYLSAPTFNPSVTATKINPTVSFTGLPSSLPYNNSYTLTAATNSSAAVDIMNTTPTVCSLTSESGAVVTLLIVADAGACSLTATWAADSNYNAASVTQSGTAARGQAVISWGAPAAIYYGTALSSVQLNATASPASIYPTPVYLPAAGRFEAAGNVTLQVTYTPHGNSKYVTTTDTVPLQVLPAATTTAVTSADQNVTLSRYGTVSATVDFNVTSYKPTGMVTLTTTPAGPTCSGIVSAATGNGHCLLKFTEAGSYTINALYAGDANHTGSDNSGQNPVVTVTVNP